MNTISAVYEDNLFYIEIKTEFVLDKTDFFKFRSQFFGNLNIVTIKYGHHYKISYNEIALKYVIDFVNSLQYVFDIDQNLLDNYQIINTWQYTDVASHLKYNPDKQYHTLTNNSELFVNDRSILNQYTTERSIVPTTLLEQIAYRKYAQVWIDRRAYSLYDVFESLLTLERIPILILIKEQSNDQFKKYNEVIEAANQANINNIGVFFRLRNPAKNNSRPNVNTTLKLEQCDIAIINSGRLPKFFVTSTWRPMAVIAMENVQMSLNKTMIYAEDKCDLLISYSKIKPFKFELLDQKKWLAIPQSNKTVQ